MRSRKRKGRTGGERKGGTRGSAKVALPAVQRFRWGGVQRLRRGGAQRIEVGECIAELLLVHPLRALDALRPRATRHQTSHAKAWRSTCAQSIPHLPAYPALRIAFDVKIRDKGAETPLSRILRHALGLLNGVLGACVCAACVCLPVSTRAMPPQPRQPCRRAPGCVLAPLGNREIAVGGESVAMHPFCVGWLG